MFQSSPRMSADYLARHLAVAFAADDLPAGRDGNPSAVVTLGDLQAIDANEPLVFIVGESHNRKASGGRFWTARRILPAVSTYSSVGVGLRVCETQSMVD